MSIKDDFGLETIFENDMNDQDKQNNFSGEQEMQKIKEIKKFTLRIKMNNMLLKIKLIINYTVKKWVMLANVKNGME